MKAFPPVLIALKTLGSTEEKENSTPAATASPSGRLGMTPASFAVKQIHHDAQSWNDPSAKLAVKRLDSCDH